MTKPMNHTSHFCVTYNHLTGKFEIDEETAIGSFGDGKGTIFENEKQEWINEDNNTSLSFDVDTFALEELSGMIQIWNKDYSMEVGEVEIGSNTYEINRIGSI